MRYFKIAILFFFIVNIFSFSFASEYDAEYLEITKEYKLGMDGKTSYTFHKKVKLNTYRATQRLFGEDFIVYNPKNQKLIINKSVTIMKNGRRVETPENGYNEVLPRGALNDPTYNHLREMVVTHTGLEIGSVIDFSYTLKNNNSSALGLMGTEVLSENFPTQQYIIKVSVPKNIELQYKFMNFEQEPDISIKNSMKTYIWKMEKIQPVINESNIGDVELFRPKLIFSSLENWNEIYSHLFTIVEDGLILNSIIKQKVDDLLEDKINQTKKMLILQDFVANKTGSVNIDLNILGYKSKSAVKTYNDNSGTGWDKAILLTSLLKEAGLKAYPVFVSRNSEFCDSIASMTQFTKCIVVCSIDGVNNYLSPMKSQKNNMEALLAGKTLFRLSKGMKMFIQIKSANYKTNKQLMTIDLKLDDELKLSGNGCFTYKGIYNSYYKIFENNDYINTMIDPCFELLKTKNNNLCVLSQQKTVVNTELSMNKELEEKNAYIYWKIPSFSVGYENSEIHTNISNRTTPLDLHQPYMECYEIELLLPENVNMLTPQKKIFFRKDFGKVSFELKEINNVIILKKCLQIKKSIISVEDYSDFKKMIMIWSDDHYSELLFKLK